MLSFTYPNFDSERTYVAGQNWVFSVTSENWETIKSRQIFAVAREPTTNRVGRGDRVLIYVVGTYSFRGIFEIVSTWSKVSVPRFPDEIREGKVKYDFEIQLSTIATGTADLRKISHSLSFIGKKQYFGIYFQRNPGNYGKPISDQDYALILQEVKQNPELLTPIVSVPQPKTPTKEVPGRMVTRGPGHFAIRDLLVEIGRLKGMEESVGEYSFDHFKLDVAWKQSRVRAFPDYAFEVHVGGDVWKDLASLKHAYDRFHCIVFLVGRPEDRELVEQILPGAYHEMSRNFKFIEIDDVSRLHQLLKESKDLERLLGL